jgi:hypothetical protein
VIDLTRTTIATPRTQANKYNNNNESHSSHIYEDDNLLNEISLNLKSTRSIPIQIITSQASNRVKFELDHEQKEKVKTEETSSEIGPTTTSDFKQKFQFIKHPRQQLSNLQSFQSFDDQLVSSMNSDRIMKSVDGSSSTDSQFSNNNQPESQQTNFIYYLDRNQHFCGY